jgi:5-methylcytosine-specific restriction endonuclease McrA
MNDKINSVKYRDRIVLRNKQWRIKNKDKYKTQGIKQRLRIHTDVVYRERILYGICCCKTKKYYADICFSFNEWMQKKLSINGLCPMCNKKFSLSRLVMDHDFALSKAKSKFLLTNKRYQYYIKDMNALCERCNNVKRTKLLIEVMEHGNH